MTGRLGQLLDLVHGTPGTTRAEAVKVLGLSSGSAAVLVTRMRQARLLTESPLPNTGTPGRPSMLLGPHPQGPLVIGASHTEGEWTVRLTELGGGVLQAARGSLDYSESATRLAPMCDAAAEMIRQFPGRVWAVGLAVPISPLLDTVDAWSWGPAAADVRRELERRAAVAVVERATTPRAAGTIELSVLPSVLAESMAALVPRRDRSDIVTLHIGVHLDVEAVLSLSGQVTPGAGGPVRRLGHLPFGDPAVACCCSRAGCWISALDDAAFARYAGIDDRRPSAGTRARLLHLAQGGTSYGQHAVDEAARWLGAGTAHVVSLLDPTELTLGGVARDIRRLAQASFETSFVEHLERQAHTGRPVVRDLAQAMPDSAASGVTELLWRDLIRRMG